MAGRSADAAGLEPEASLHLAEVEASLARHNLTVLGGLDAREDEGLPEGTRTILLIGPREPGFWAHLTGEAEWQDGMPDPVDRWSCRVIGQVALELAAEALFPFGPPPHWPFYQWALRSGRAFTSPVTLLVHAQAGLFLSYRGAIAMRQRIALPPHVTRPCDSCAEKPCLTACPPRALTGNGYDVPACHDFLDLAEGEACLSRGCGVRRACPVSKAYGRVAEQSAYHMRLFHK